MFNPSGFVLEEGRNFEITEVENGVFVVDNAYEGNYEYFQGRPITSQNEEFDKKRDLHNNDDGVFVEAR